MKLVFSNQAESQFRRAVSFIASEKPKAARAFRDHAMKLLQRLRRYPNSGRVPPEFPELPYREVIIPPYRFFHLVVDGDVSITAVWHGSRRTPDKDDLE